MKDPRITQLAQQLVNYSVKAKPGDNVLIENTGLTVEFVEALVKAVYDAGANPHVQLSDSRVRRAQMLGGSDAHFAKMAEFEAARMRQMQCYIGVRAGDNAQELSDVPAARATSFNKLFWKPVHGEIRVPDTRWVVLRYPTPSMAQQAGMSTEAFEDFYFDVCCMDYARMARAMEKLVARMARTRTVRLTAPGTDLSFCIEGIPAIACAGELNIPDGEVFTAPVKNSVNGTIRYNAPSVYDGFCFENVTLTFRDGKIIEAHANDDARVNEIFDTDEGARYVGEFAIGVHPSITKPMKDTLFDEKIAGSIHFTPGNCYDEAENGNKSAVHWDLVLIQRPECGGGDMYFDGELVRRDGLFVTPDLLCLNPDQLR